jgi:hypothetical protein
MSFSLIIYMLVQWGAYDMEGELIPPPPPHPRHPILEKEICHNTVRHVQL